MDGLFVFIYGFTYVCLFIDSFIRSLIYVYIYAFIYILFYFLQNQAPTPMLFDDIPFPVSGLRFHKAESMDSNNNRSYLECVIFKVLKPRLNEVVSVILGKCPRPRSSSSLRWSKNLFIFLSGTNARSSYAL